MVDVPVLGQGSRLDFHGPLGASRASRLVADLASREPMTVLDLGCGWGELMLRVLEAVPTARGTGVDIDPDDLERGRRNAAARGLADRVSFVEGQAKEHMSPADLVFNVGAFHAFGSVRDALESLRDTVNPGGRLLFAAEFWDRAPTEDEMARLWPGTTAEECQPDLVGLVDLATGAGWRPLQIGTATAQEWEAFESGYAAECEEWLIANGDHPEAGRTREALDRHRSYWLRGYRNLMGFAYLTLGMP